MWYATDNQFLTFRLAVAASRKRLTMRTSCVSALRAATDPKVASLYKLASHSLNKVSRLTEENTTMLQVTWAGCAKDDVSDRSDSDTGHCLTFYARLGALMGVGEMGGVQQEEPDFIQGWAQMQSPGSVNSAWPCLKHSRNLGTIF